MLTEKEANKILTNCPSRPARQDVENIADMIPELFAATKGQAKERIDAIIRPADSVQDSAEHYQYCLDYIRGQAARQRFFQPEHINERFMAILFLWRSELNPTDYTASIKALIRGNGPEDSKNGVLELYHRGVSPELLEHHLGVNIVKLLQDTVNNPGAPGSHQAIARDKWVSVHSVPPAPPIQGRFASEEFKKLNDEYPAKLKAFHQNAVHLFFRRMRRYAEGNTTQAQRLRDDLRLLLSIDPAQAYGIIHHWLINSANDLAHPVAYSQGNIAALTDKQLHGLARFQAQGRFSPPRPSAFLPTLHTACQEYKQANVASYQSGFEAEFKAAQDAAKAAGDAAPDRANFLTTFKSKQDPADNNRTLKDKVKVVVRDNPDNRDLMSRMAALQRLAEHAYVKQRSAGRRFVDKASFLSHGGGSASMKAVANSVQAYSGELRQAIRANARQVARLEGLLATKFDISGVRHRDMFNDEIAHLQKSIERLESEMTWIREKRMLLSALTDPNPGGANDPRKAYIEDVLKQEGAVGLGELDKFETFTLTEFKIYKDLEGAQEVLPGPHAGIDPQVGAVLGRRAESPFIAERETGKMRYHKSESDNITIAVCEDTKTKKVSLTCVTVAESRMPFYQSLSSSRVRQIAIDMVSKYINDNMSAVFQRVKAKALADNKAPEEAIKLAKQAQTAALKELDIPISGFPKGSNEKALKKALVTVCRAYNIKHHVMGEKTKCIPSDKEVEKMKQDVSNMGRSHTAPLRAALVTLGQCVEKDATHVVEGSSRKSPGPGRHL